MPQVKFKNPKTKYLALSAIIILSAGFFFYQNFSARSASYSFFQTDWSGGESATTAAHPGDSSGWDKYSSADATIATGTAGQISLSSTTASWVQTETADFSTGIFSATAATSGKVVLLKPAGVACTSGAECLGGYCDGAGYCSTCESFTYESQTYATVVIGEQCWMAENLNVGVYATSTDTGLTHSDVTNNAIIEKYCYNNTESICDTDGGLYDWNEMMGYTTVAGAQGICAPGWHIPTDAEWYELENGLATEDCSASRVDWGCNPAGSLLKTGGTSDFEALLAGYRDLTGAWSSRGSHAYFWSSSVSGGAAWRRYLSSSESRVNRYTYYQTGGFSVRCLKN